MPPPIDFCTFAMFIIDEIEFPPPTPPAKDVIGGAGSYASLGARLLSPPPVSTTVGWIVDKGSDFPPQVLDQLHQWQTSCLIREDPSRLTTRGWNGYEGNENRAFKYTTPKVRIDTESLPPHLLMSAAFHMVCSPQRCIDLVSSLRDARRKIDPSAPKPIIVWEPVPDLCTPDQLLKLTEALRVVTVCSPNHLELGGFLGQCGALDDGTVDRAFVEQGCMQLLESMPITSYSLIIRSGKDGCYVCKPQTKDPAPLSSIGNMKKKPRSTPQFGTGGGLSMVSPGSVDFLALFQGKNWSRDEETASEEKPNARNAGVDKWLPAYHDNKSRVVDPTGGGNTFLGAMAVALARGQTVEEAALWGTVAASFAIEQVGMPQLDHNEKNEETWNGAKVNDRLENLKNRLRM